MSTLITVILENESEPFNSWHRNEKRPTFFFLVVFWFCFLRKDDLNILYRAIVEVGRAWVSLGRGTWHLLASIQAANTR